MKAITFLAGASAIALMPSPAAAQITITITTATVHRYDSPNSEPVITTDSIEDYNCPVRDVLPIIDGRGGGGEGGDKTDADGDGVGSGDDDNDNDPSVGGRDGGDGGGGKVLCTYFYAKGLLPEEVYRADNAYAAAHVSENVRKGYHSWAIPMVRALQTGRHPVGEQIAYFFVKAWAYEMAYIMGVAPRSTITGRMMRRVGEPLCGLTGKMVMVRSRFVRLISREDIPAGS